MAYYLGSSFDGTVGGVKFGDEDILKYDGGSEAWSLFFDGSDVGLGGADVDAFTVRADGSLLINLVNPINLGTLGEVDDSDILLFAPTSLGTTTAGTFSLYFDGADVGLTTDGEDIDGLAELTNGQLLITTQGSVAVTGVSAKDKDLLAFAPTGLGSNTAGTWSLYFEGADIGLTTADEDVHGIYMTAGGDLYLTMLGGFQIGGISGGGTDVVVCRLISGGTNSVCSPPASIAWLGSAHGFATGVIDSFYVDLP